MKQFKLWLKDFMQLEVMLPVWMVVILIILAMVNVAHSAIIIAIKALS